VLVSRGRHRGAGAITTLGDALLALPGTNAPSADEVIALARVAEIFYRAGAHDHGAPLQKMAEERARRLEPPSDKVEGFLSWTRAWRALRDGDVKGAYEHDEAAARAFERAAEIRMSCYARANLGYEEMRLGLLEDARASFESASETADRLGLTTVGAMALHNLGLVYDWLGMHEEALATERRATERFELLDHSRLVCACYEYLARIHLTAGRADEAAEAARRAAERGAGWPDMVLLNRATLARALLTQGRVDEALDHTAAAMAASRVGGSSDGEHVYIAVARLEALVAAGELAEARDLLHWADAEVERQAAGLGPLRSGFLERVPEHRRLRELREELT
jgi:tetratricopeptide (TPR) repeat protein